MREIKWLLGVLLGAGYASVCWAAGVFGSYPGLGFLYIPVILIGLAMIAGSVLYLGANWQRE